MDQKGKLKFLQKECIDRLDIYNNVNVCMFTSFTCNMNSYFINFVI